MRHTTHRVSRQPQIICSASRSSLDKWGLGMVSIMFSGIFTSVTTEHNLENPQRNPALSRRSLLRRLAFVLGVASVLVLAAIR
jgi:agmatine/peptidylarginine deiminase